MEVGTPNALIKKIVQRSSAQPIICFISNHLGGFKALSYTTIKTRCFPEDYVPFSISIKLEIAILYPILTDDNDVSDASPQSVGWESDDVNSDGDPFSIRFKASFGNRVSNRLDGSTDHFTLKLGIHTLQYDMHALWNYDTQFHRQYT